MSRHRRGWGHADATITALAIGSPGHVPWWPRPDVKLFNVLVRMLTETSRHAGHADFLREQLDNSTGTTAEYALPQDDPAFWEAHCAKIERAAEAAFAKADRVGSANTSADLWRVTRRGRDQILFRALYDAVAAAEVSSGSPPAYEGGC